MIDSVGRYRKLVRRLGHERWVAWSTRRFGWRLDRRLYRWSGGRVSLMGPDVMLLTTRGRRSGRTRETPVIYIRDGADFVVSSEDFGQPRPAAWPLNLEADPAAAVMVGGEVLRCRARRLGEAEADRHWPRLLEACPAHATYRRRSGRRHVFALTPVA